MAENAVATVKGGLYEQYGTTLTQIQGTGPARRRIRMWLASKGLRDLRARMTALDGVAAGAAALKVNARVEANVELGGVRAIENETLINRVTVAGDTTIIEGDINTYTTKTTMASPANLDGNPLGTR